jgi:hypothetical protein
VVTDSLASAAGRDTAGPIGSRLDGSARLVVTDSLARAAGRNAHLPVARPGRTMIGPDPTAARLVVTDSFASAAGRDTAGPIGSGLDGSSPRGDR